MTNELPNLDRIEDYLHGIMPPEEAARFESELAANPALRKEYDLVNDMLTGIEQFGDDMLKAQIGAAHNELAAEGFFEKKTAVVRTLQPVRQRLWYRWAAAASFLVICGAALFFWWKTQDPYKDMFRQSFYAENVKIATVIDDSSAPGLMVPNREQLDSRADALKLYLAKDYVAAQKALATHLENYPKDTTAQVYLGITEIALSQYSEAIARLESIAPEVLTPNVRLGTSLPENFQNEITWYLALAYSQRPDKAAKDSTLLLLRRLEARGDSTYSEKARNALQLLE